MIAIVIEIDNFQVKFVINNRLQFLQIHLEATITIYTNHALTFFSNASTNGSWEAIAHSCTTRVGKQTGMFLHNRSLESNHTGTAITTYNLIIFFKTICEFFNKHVRVQYFTLIVFRQSGWVFQVDSMCPL